MIKETFEIHTVIDKTKVLNIDPLLFVIIIMIITILLYILRYKTH